MNRSLIGVGAALFLTSVSGFCNDVHEVVYGDWTAFYSDKSSTDSIATTPSKKNGVIEFSVTLSIANNCEPLLAIIAPHSNAPDVPMERYDLTMGFQVDDRQAWEFSPVNVRRANELDQVIVRIRRDSSLMQDILEGDTLYMVLMGPRGKTGSDHYSLSGSKAAIAKAWWNCKKIQKST